MGSPPQQQQQQQQQQLFQKQQLRHASPSNQPAPQLGSPQHSSSLSPAPRRDQPPPRRDAALSPSQQQGQPQAQSPASSLSSPLQQSPPQQQPPQQQPLQQHTSRHQSPQPQTQQSSSPLFGCPRGSPESGVLSRSITSPPPRPPAPTRAVAAAPSPSPGVPHCPTSHALAPTARIHSSVPPCACRRLADGGRRGALAGLVRRFFETLSPPRLSLLPQACDLQPSVSTCHTDETARATARAACFYSSAHILAPCMCVASRRAWCECVECVGSSVANSI